MIHLIRNPWTLLSPLLFTMGGSLLFVLALGSDTEKLGVLSPGIIWTLLLFAFFLSLNDTFKEDSADGTLDQQYLRSSTLVPYFLRKVILHWLFSALPLILLCPLFLVILNAPSSYGVSFLISLVLTTPTLSLLGVLCECLSIGAKNNVFLGALILLPFSIPLLVFATALGQSSLDDPQGRVAALLLLAFLCTALALCPPLGGLILKQVIRDA